MPVEIIKRKTTNHHNLRSQTPIITHIEIGSMFSRGALIALAKKEPRLIKEIKIYTRDFTESPKTGKYKTITGRALSKKSINQITNQILSDLFKNTNLSFEDINYISTHYGEYASLRTPGELITLIDKILTYSQEKLKNKPKKIKFKPPTITANEIKNKMISSGARRIIKSLSIDSPRVFLDFSTYLSGVVFSNLRENNVSCLVSGLGFEILNALARGHSDVDSEKGTALQVPKNDGEVYEEVATELTSQVSELLNIRRIPSGTKKFGKVPVDVNESYEREVKLIGCDVGKNGSDLEKVTKIGRRAASYGNATLSRVVEKLQARLTGRVIKVMYEENLLNQKYSVCLSGRWETQRNKTKILTDYLKEIGFRRISGNLKFIENPTSFGSLPESWNEKSELS